MSEKIIPLGDYVIVQLVEQKKTKGGLFIPDKPQTSQRDAIVGKVLAAGPGRVSDYGTTMLAGVKEGDYVLLARGAGTEVALAAENQGGRLRIIRGGELLGVVEESRIIQLGLA